MLRMLGIWLLVLLLGGPAGSEDLPDKDEVLAQFVEAVGGRQALQAGQQLRCSGVIVQDLTWKDPRHSETPFVALATATGEVRYAESAEWAALPAADVGEPRNKVRWVLHPAFALVVEDFFPDLQVVSREVRDGRSVIVLAPAGLDFGNYALYFDEETGLLNHIGYHNDLRDWREVAGVLRPHEMVFGRKGGHTTWRFDTMTTQAR